MNELANIVIGAVPNCKSKVVHKKHGTDGIRSVELEIMRRIPATEKANQELGFIAGTPLKAGIEEILINQDIVTASTL